MNPGWQTIQVGDDVIWSIAVDNGYHADFLVLNIYRHEFLKDESGELALTALIQPLNPELFCAQILKGSTSLSDLVRIEVPLTMLTPVIHHTIH